MKLQPDQLRGSSVLDVGNGRVIRTVNTFGRTDLSLDDYNNNIYCTDGDNKIIWRVQAPETNAGRESFVGVVKDGDMYVAIRELGNHFQLDVEIGSLKYLRHAR